MIKVCLFRELFHLSKVPFVDSFLNLSKPFSLANLKGFERSDNSMANTLYIRGLISIAQVRAGCNLQLYNIQSAF